LGTSKIQSEKPIVFFDGICGLCNGLVNFLMRIDRKRILCYAPLQGETAKEKLMDIEVKNLNSIVYYRSQKTLQKSNAIIQLLVDLGGFWKITIIFKILPLSFRDSIYNFIAKNRYKWFNKKNICRVPTAKEKDRILP